MLFPLIVGVSVAGLMATAKDGHLSAWGSWWGSLTNPAESGKSNDRFKVSLLDQINYVRIAAKLPPLKIDPDLQKFMERYEQGVPCDDLDEVTQSVQTSLPRYFRVSACTATRPNSQELLQEFQPFSQKTDAAMTHFACLLKSSSGGLSQTCLIVVGQRLEDFSPEQLNARKSDAFFNVCSLCRHPHVCRVSYQQSSMTLECPSCNRIYAVVAADSHGRFRYVNEFLSGFQPPARFPKDQSQIQKLFTIWSAVHRDCLYTLDPETKKKQSDCWQTALETQNLQRGDCEDSSIFLADWLESQGFQVRVALGKYGDLGGHAWCVVRLDGNDYLLESTAAKPDVSNPPLSDIVGSRYVPEVQFDRNAIYVRTKVHQTWAGDYWSSKQWTRIEPRHPSVGANGMSDQKSADSAAVTARQSSRLFVDKSRLAVTKSPQPSVGPLAALMTVPPGGRWEVHIEDKFPQRDGDQKFPAQRLPMR